MIPAFFYDLYWILIIGICLVVATILLIGAGAVIRRFTRGRYYRRRDEVRRRYSALIEGLNPAEPVPTALRRKPGSMEWEVIEEILCHVIGNAVPPLRDFLIRSVDRLGYVDWRIGQLRKGNRWRKAIAAGKLGRMRHPKAAEPLLAALEYPHGDVQTAVVRALESFRDASVAGPLIRKIYAASHGEIGVALRVLKPAIIAVGPGIIPILREGLLHESWRVRSAVVDILTEIGDADSAPDLRSLLKDPEPDVRAKAARAVGRLGNITAVPLLTALLDDPFWVVRLHATRALGMMHYPYAMKPLISKMADENWQVRAAAAEALRQYGDCAVEALLTVIINGTDRYAREQFMEELQRSGLLESYIDTLGDGASESAKRSSAIISEYIRMGMTSLLLHHKKHHPDPAVRKSLLELFDRFPSPGGRDGISDRRAARDQDDLAISPLREERSSRVS